MPPGTLCPPSSSRLLRTAASESPSTRATCLVVSDPLGGCLRRGCALIVDRASVELLTYRDHARVRLDKLPDRPPCRWHGAAVVR